MNKNLLFLLSLLTSLNVLSQITLTRENSYPIVGDELIYNEYLNFSPIFISDEAGTTWDYSNIQAFSNDYEVSTIAAPTDVAGFEEANLANLDQYDVIYKEVDDTKVSLWGFASPQDNTIYSDALDELRFPMNLDSAFDDTFSSTRYDLDGTSQGTQVGTATVEARAEGIIILPFGTQVEVLKITSESEWFSDESGQVLYTVKIDTWYDGITRAYLAQSTHFELSSGDDLDFFTFLSEDDYTYLNVEELEFPVVKLYPNPTADYIFIENLSKIALEFTLLDSNGQQIYSWNTGTAVNYKLDLPKLNKGIYFLKLTNNKGTRVKKISVI